MSESESVVASRDADVVAEPGSELEGSDASPGGSYPDELQIQEPQDQLPLDVIFDILKNQRRRHVVRYLQEHQVATLSDLAEHVAALENDKDIRNLTSSERKRVYVGLYQCHLPRMDDAGVIDFDSDRGTIELNHQAEQLDAYLIDDDESDRNWSLLYLSTSITGGGVYALSTSVISAGELVSSAVVFATLLVVAGCSLMQHSRRTDTDTN